MSGTKYKERKLKMCMEKLEKEIDTKSLKKIYHTVFF